MKGKRTTRRDTTPEGMVRGTVYVHEKIYDALRKHVEIFGSKVRVVNAAILMFDKASMEERVQAIEQLNAVGCGVDE